MEFSKWNEHFFCQKSTFSLFFFCNWLAHVNKFILSINMLYLKISVLSADISLALIIIFAFACIVVKEKYR